jgi:hypothetical protein
VGDRLGILYGQESPWVGPVEAAYLIACLVRGWDVRPERIVYDAGGGRGLSIAPFLAQHDIHDAVPYRGSGSGGKRFANRRTRMAWKLKDRLDPQMPKPPPALVYDPYHEPSPFDPVVTHQFGLQPPFCLPDERPWWPLLQEELKALYWHHKGKVIALETKEEMSKRLKKGRSPNVLDALAMRFVLDDGEE